MTDFERTQILGQRSALDTPRDARLVPMDGADAVALGGSAVHFAVATDGALTPTTGAGTDTGLELFRHAGAWGLRVLAPDLRVRVRGSVVTLCFLQSGDPIEIGTRVYRFRYADEADSAEDATSTLVFDTGQGHKRAVKDTPEAVRSDPETSSVAPARATGSRGRTWIWILLLFAAVAIGLGLALI